VEPNGSDDEDIYLRVPWPDGCRLCHRAWAWRRRHVVRLRAAEAKKR